MESQFKIGQQVKAVSFTDCFGKVVAETPNLTVSEIRLIECNSMKPYFRVKADGFCGNYIEGAERYFAPMADKCACRRPDFRQTSADVTSFTCAKCGVTEYYN